MRALLFVAAAGLVLGGCDQIQNFAQKAKPAPAAPAAPAPAQAAAAPALEATPAAPAADTAAVPASAQAPAGPPTVQVVHWSPADYAKREKHLQAMIANAETRDTTGETQRRAEEGRYRRAHCASRACTEASYASEEAWLKQWEGS